MKRSRLEWKEYTRLGGDKTYRANLKEGEVPPELRLYEHDRRTFGYYEIAENINKNSCLWFKEAGRDSDLVKVCDTPEEAQNHAQKLHDEWAEQVEQGREEELKHEVWAAYREVKAEENISLYQIEVIIKGLREKAFEELEVACTFDDYYYQNRR